MPTAVACLLTGRWLRPVPAASRCAHKHSRVSSIANSPQPVPAASRRTYKESRVSSIANRLHRLCMCGGAWRMALCRMTQVALVLCWPSAREAGGMPKPGECEGCWEHAHAGRGRGTLGGMPMPGKCEGSWEHAHADRVQGMLRGMPMPGECEGRWVHAHAVAYLSCL
ncbi:hypothetical protein HAX54_013029 [Datura stramonium]|uniref:Uncharacterized protein n=1 Tax=Datura stramonium TaxID=4076 RepID=A0ABS8TKM3_DATST|nr:hypothetical protein [Datura stramonium]